MPCAQVSGQSKFVITNLDELVYAAGRWRRKPPADTSLRSQVYDSLRDALTAGRFTPGQKLTFRFIAGTLGVSLTPVREAVRRLVAEGAFEMRPNRSVRVPLMTRDKILELRDIRMAVEGLATEKAAALRDPRARSPQPAADRDRAAWPCAAAATPPRTARRSASSISRSTPSPASRPCCA